MSYVRESQYTLARDVLKGIFKLNDSMFEKFIKSLSTRTS